MATKRKTGAVIQTFKHNNTITYSADQPGGSVHARKQFSVSMIDDDTVRLAADGVGVTGELLDVEADGYCSVIVEGQGLQGKMGAANGVGINDKVVGAVGPSVGGQTGGYLKNGGTDTDGRGNVTSREGTAAGSVVTYNL